MTGRPIGTFTAVLGAVPRDPEVVDFEVWAPEVSSLAVRVNGRDEALEQRSGRELLAEAEELRDDGGPVQEVEPLERATALENGPAGLPERAGALRAERRRSGQGIETARPRHLPLISSAARGHIGTSPLGR